MICPSCQTKNNYYHKYCYNCGTRLITEEELQEASDTAAETDEMPSEPHDESDASPHFTYSARRKRKKVKYYLYSAIAILLIVALFVIASLFNSGSSPAPDKKADASAQAPETQDAASNQDETDAADKQSEEDGTTDNQSEETGTIGNQGEETGDPGTGDGENNTATNPDQANVNLDLSEEEYLAKAVILDYSTLAAAGDVNRGKIVSVQGTVSKVLRSEKPPQFILNMNGKSSQPVTIEYFGDTAIIEGRKLKMVGEMSGSAEDNPKMNARLAYRIRE